MGSVEKRFVLYNHFWDVQKLPPARRVFPFIISYFTFQNIPVIKANPAPLLSHPETSQTTSTLRPPQPREVIAYNLSHADQASGVRAQFWGSTGTRRAGRATGVSLSIVAEGAHLWHNAGGYTYRTTLIFKREGSLETWAKCQREGPRCCPTGKKQCSELDSQLWHWDILGQIILCGGAVLCPVGYLVAFLAFTHSMPGPLPQLDNHKCPSWGVPNVLWLRTIRQTQLCAFPSALRVWTRYFRVREGTERAPAKDTYVK